MTASKTKKTNPKNVITKASTRSATKTSQLVDAQQPNKPSKDATMAAFITPEKLQLIDKHEDNVTSTMIVDTSQASNNNAFNSTSTIDPSSCLGKRSSDNKDPLRYVHGHQPIDRS